MKYMLLIYVTEADMTANQPGDIDRHLAMTEKAIASDAYVGCDALEPTASAIRINVKDGEVHRTDGPFTELKEVLGGFYTIDCASDDEAIALASEIPQPPHGAIEIRRIATIPGWDESVAEIRSRVGKQPHARRLTPHGRTAGRDRAHVPRGVRPHPRIAHSRLR